MWLNKNILFLSDGKLKNNTAVINNSSKHIGNSIVKDNKDIIDNEISKRPFCLDDDTLSNNSMGSHKNRKIKGDGDSHKGSSESMEDGDEKKDASKEDLEDGMILDGTHSLALLFIIYYYLSYYYIIILSAIIIIIIIIIITLYLANL